MNVPLILRFFKKLKNVTNSKTYVFLIASKRIECNDHYKKSFTSRKKCLLHIKFL